MDFFFCECLETSHSCRLEFCGDLLRVFLYLFSEREDRVFPSCKSHDLMILECDKLGGNPRNGIDITREEYPCIRNSYNHRTSELRPQYHIRMLTISDDKCIGTDELSKYYFKCSEKIAIIHIFHELRDDLSIRLRVELVSFFLQCFSQFMIVLDDPIMYDEKSHIRGKMWMCIFLCHASVCRPASMCDTRNIRFRRIGISLDLGREVRYLPDGFLEEKITSGRNGEHSSTIVTTIFEVTESLDEKGDRIFRAIVGKYSAHNFGMN